MTKLQGGCLCQSVRFTCNTAPIHTFYCHCRDCQPETGGPFAMELYVPRTGLTIDGMLNR